MLNIDDGPPTPPETFYLWATFTLGIVPVFDIKTYEMVYEYAMFAIGAQFKNEVTLLSLLRMVMRFV